MNERHRNKRLAALRYLLALPRSLDLNFRLLPFRQARRLPLLVSHRTRILNLSGSISLHADSIRVGLVKIGFNTCQLSDFHYHRTLLNLRGNVRFLGECAIGAGSSIEVSEGATLTLGDHFNLGPRSLVICHSSISFGSHVLTSWCCTIMDTDQHRLVDGSGSHLNPDRPVAFADHIWLGCNVIVTKGTTLPSFTTVGAGSCVHGIFTEQKTVLAGNPAQIVRRSVMWDGH